MNTRYITRGLVGAIGLTALALVMPVAEKPKQTKDLLLDCAKPNPNFVRTTFSYPFNRVGGQATVSYDPSEPFDKGYVEITFDPELLRQNPLPPEIDLPNPLGLKSGTLTELVITSDLTIEGQQTALTVELSENIIGSRFVMDQHTRIDEIVKNKPITEVSACWVNGQFIEKEGNSVPERR